MRTSKTINAIPFLPSHFIEATIYTTGIYVAAFTVSYCDNQDQKISIIKRGSEYSHQASAYYSN